MTSETFAEFLRVQRLAAGVTLADVGAALGVSTSFVHDVENGRRNPPVPTPERIYALAEVLRLDAQAIADRLVCFRCGALAAHWRTC